VTGAVPARRGWLGAVVAVLGLVGCGTTTDPHQARSGAIRALQAQARPIGRGPGFHAPVAGHVPGPCRRRRGPRAAVHVELFAADRVVLIPAGVGVRGPLRRLDGRIVAARCYGDLVTLDPTGVVLVRPGTQLTLADLFSAWGQPLSAHRLAAFPAGDRRRVRVYVGGRRRQVDPGAVRLTRHAEIVLEVGPYVPPHARFTFAAG
jgi:hypothetical protein